MAEMEDKFEEMQMEQAAGEGGGAGSSSGGGGGPSGEVEVPDEYLCPITSEIMTDPVVTVRFTALAPHNAAYSSSSHVAG